MLEETGLKVTTIKHVSPSLLTSSGLTDEATLMVFVDVTGTPSPAPEASEAIEVMLLDYDAALRLCDDQSALLDAKVWLVLWMIRTLGRID
jgi:hypothetical protein